MARLKTGRLVLALEKCELIKNMLDDIATHENRSLSAIAERLLLGALLPKNKDAQFIATNYLYGTGNSDIGKALGAIFSINAAGVNFHAKHDNLLPLVQYAASEAVFCNSKQTGEEEMRPYAMSQLESVVRRLDGLSKSADTDEKRYYYERESKWCAELLKEFKEEPEHSILRNFYQVLLNSWEDFEDWTITYRLLYALCELESDWRTDSSARMELLELMKVVTDEWEE